MRLGSSNWSPRVTQAGGATKSPRIDALPKLLVVQVQNPSTESAGRKDQLLRNDLLARMTRMAVDVVAENQPRPPR